jgi:hypothetical protein
MGVNDNKYDPAAHRPKRLLHHELRRAMAKVMMSFSIVT